MLQMKLGWTEAAMIAGAKDIDMSPSIVGSFARKEAELVEVNTLLLHSLSVFLISFILEHVLKRF